jgi:hypothetical protein
MRTIRLLLIIQAVAFLAAALTHFGILAGGYKHRQAGTAESVIGSVLLLGWTLSLVRPLWAIRIAIAVQGFALCGTLVGIFTIVVGVGPRTRADIIYHVCIVAVLLSGLIWSINARSRQRELLD